MPDSKVEEFAYAADADTEPIASRAALSPNLHALLTRAGWLGQLDGSEPVLSFTSIFLAFAASKDPTSTWFQEKLEWIGPSLDDVVRQWSRVVGTAKSLVSAARVQAAADLTIQPDDGDQMSRTRSARFVLERAERFRLASKTTVLDVHHVLAVYFFDPAGHADDLRAWHLNREAWATRFLVHVAERYVGEVAYWRTVVVELFPRKDSVGIKEVRRRAERMADAAVGIDRAALVGGILLDGRQYSGDPVTSAQFLASLGDFDLAPLVERANDSTLPRRSVRDDPDVARLFDRARVFATVYVDPENRELNVRHLVAAILTDSAPLPAFIRRDSALLLARFRRDLLAANRRDDDARAWERLFDEFRDDGYAGYANDLAIGEDLIGITRDVRALASVLASTQTAPPLSVGICGNWGTGKSFFMTKLKSRIEQIANTAAGRSPEDSWLCGARGKVVQVEFNAWHYMTADLWSSLAVRVFDELSRVLKTSFAKACAEKLSSVKAREAELTSETERLAATAKKLDKEIAEHQSARQIKEASFSQLVKGLVDNAKLQIDADPDIAGAKKQLKLHGDLSVEQFQAIRDELSGWTGIARYVAARPARLAAFGIALVVPLFIGLLASWYSNLLWGAAATAGTIVASFTIVASWVHAKSSTLRGVADRAITSMKRIEEQVRADRSPSEDALLVERASIAARIQGLEQERAVYVSQAKALEAERDALERADDVTLRDFLSEKTSASAYRKNLGVVGALQKDFEELTRFLEPSAVEPNVERIILYIDDLDRCPPERVIEVLQAVHVLLSMPLFVVVVGVDSRWMLDSLRTYYQKQFPANDSLRDPSRPQQYLEKIFQIPFTLSPMQPASYERLVASLLGVTELPDHATPHEAFGEHASEEAVSAPASAPGPASSRAAALQISNRVQLKPRGLRLEPPEIACAAELSDLISSPREGKRLVNLYRIVRSTLDDTELAALVDGRYRLTLWSLAMLIGSPTCAVELFQRILGGSLSSRNDLVQWCRDAENHRDRDARWRIGVAATLTRNALFADWAATREILPRVARFSFEAGRILGTGAVT